MNVLSQDLLKHTPKDHPDFPLLQDALRISQNFLSSINEEIDPRRTAVTTPKGEVCVCVLTTRLVKYREVMFISLEHLSSLFLSYEILLGTLRKL